MKIHEQIEEWLAAAVTGGLSAEERRNFERHLAKCEHCRTLHQEEKNMSQAICDTFDAHKPDANFENRILQNFRRSSRSVRRFQLGAWLLRFGQMRSVQWAAALLLVTALVKGGQFLTNSAPGGIAAQNTHGILAPHNTLAWGHAFDRGDLNYKSSLAVNGFQSNGSAAETAPRDEFSLSAANSYTGSTAVAGGIMSADAGEASAGLGIEEKQKAGAVDFFKKPPEDARLKSGLADLSKETSKLLSANRDSERGRLALAQKSDAAHSAAAPETPSLPVQAQSPQSPPPIAPDTARKLIRNATLEFEVKNFENALETIRGITGEEQGYVATADSSRGANGKLRGTAVVKMLPANLDRFLLKLRALGELKNQRLGSDDVTKAYFDTDARLRNAKRMEERLLDMLQKATGKVSDLLQVEKELNRIREQIEQMQGELKYWDTLVGYATVTISLYEKDLNEPAAFLLKERANLSLFSPDVEKTYTDAKREAGEAKAQVLQSKLERDSEGRISATLSLLLAPETAGQTIARMKTLGRVQTFNTHDERVAQGGSGASDTARVERDKVEFNLVIAHDDESRRKTNLAVVTREVEANFDKVKSSAAAQGAEVINSSVNRDPQGRSQGLLTLRVPAKAYRGLLENLQSLGRVASLAIERNERAGDDESGPVLISLTLTSEESPVQQTHVNVLTERVEEKSAAIKEAAGGAGAELKSSTFERQNGGVEVANLTFSLPLKNYAPFVEQIKRLGKVSNFTVQRNDSAERASESAPAQIALQIYSRGDIVSDENGAWATLRATFVQAFATVMWSVRMIGVALAFIVPWALALGALAWVVRRVRRASRARK